VASIRLNVDTNGLPEKLSVFTHTQAKQAVRSGRAGIRSSTKTVGYTVTGRVFPSGPHAHIMRWQDQGTGPRHTKRGADRGSLVPQYFFERGAEQVRVELPAIIDAAIEAGLVKSGLK
jgi:hypothetical protein